MEELYSVVETAKKLKISTVTLRRLIRARKIPYHRTSWKIFFTDSDLIQYLESISFPILKEVK